METVKNNLIDRFFFGNRQGIGMCVKKVTCKKAIKQIDQTAKYRKIQTKKESQHIYAAVKD
nr:hypothetical protein [uncultured Anaerostipes sp.]